MARQKKIDLRFGKRLRELREAHGSTQAALAEAAGMVPNALARLERGERQPSWDAVLRLAAALGVGVEEFAIDAKEA